MKLEEIVYCLASVNQQQLWHVRLKHSGWVKAHEGVFRLKEVEDSPAFNSDQAYDGLVEVLFQHPESWKDILLLIWKLVDLILTFNQLVDKRVAINDTRLELIQAPLEVSYFPALYQVLKDLSVSLDLQLVGLLDGLSSLILLYSYSHTGWKLLLAFWNDI